MRVITGRKANFKTAVFVEFNRLVNEQKNITQKKAFEIVFASMQTSYRKNGKIDDLPKISYLKNKYFDMRPSAKKRAIKNIVEPVQSDIESEVDETESEAESEIEIDWCMVRRKKKPDKEISPPFIVSPITPAESQFLAALPVHEFYTSVMKNKPIAWLFCNTKFNNGMERVGGKIAIKKLYNYDVTLYENLTSVQLKAKSIEFARLRHHVTRDRVLIIWNSHGLQDTILGSDNISVRTDELRMNVLSSTLLANKLKIIMFVACRAHNPAYRIPDLDCDDARTHLDSLVIYSQPEGHNSLRSPDVGCRFLNELTKQLATHATSKCLQKTMNIVTGELANQPSLVDTQTSYQIPSVTGCLRKGIFLPTIIRK